MRLLSAAAVAMLGLMAATGASAKASISIEVFGVGDALGRLFLPAGGPARGRMPVVVVIGDVQAPDTRSERYIDRLNAFGIAALDLNAADAGDAPAREQPAVEAVLARATAELAEDGRFDPGRIGFLGFGTGARAAFLAAWDPDGGRSPQGAIALLYPGCAAVSETLHEFGSSEAVRRAPVLLLHGDNDPANPPATCAALAEELARLAPVRRIEYRGAGYGWDRPRYGAEGSTTVPRPDGSGRIRAAFWPDLADLSAEHVAGFFWLILEPGR